VSSTELARTQQGPRVPTQPQMSKDEARALTERVRLDFGVLWAKVLDLYERGAHLALGYSTWGAYWQGEFAMSPARGEQLVRAGRVARELERAGLPLPANDLTARALAPVLRSAPDKLAELWQRALDQHDTPNARQVRAIVQPYAVRSSPAHAAGTPARMQAAATRRARAALEHSLDDARAAIEAALTAVDDALSSDPDADRRRYWLEHAEQLSQLASELEGRLR
jgi:hypothetical protein